MRACPRPVAARPAAASYPPARRRARAAVTLAMTRRPRILDLFCGAGGCSVGYARAGLDVILGVDKAAQANYPYSFLQTDALAFLRDLIAETADGYRLADFDFIHASPPCQAHSRAQVLQGNDHPELIGPTRDLLQQTGIPWVIENVPGAPVRPDLILCGTMFDLKADGFGLQRHRLFEFSDSRMAPVLVPPCTHVLPAMPVFGHSPNANWMRKHGRSMPASVRAEAMGIDWMNRDELSEAIPPTYTEMIGAHLIDRLHIAA